jgi:hypothetical protein
MFLKNNFFLLMLVLFLNLNSKIKIFDVQISTEQNNIKKSLIDCEYFYFHNRGNKILSCRAYAIIEKNFLKIYVLLSNSFEKTLYIIESNKKNLTENDWKIKLKNNNKKINPSEIKAIDRTVFYDNIFGKTNMRFGSLFEASFNIEKIDELNLNNSSILLNNGKTELEIELDKILIY